MGNRYCGIVGQSYLGDNFKAWFVAYGDLKYIYRARSESTKDSGKWITLMSALFPVRGCVNSFKINWALHLYNFKIL